MSFRCEILKSLIMSRAADSLGVSVQVPSRLNFGASVWGTGFVRAKNLKNFSRFVRFRELVRCCLDSCLLAPLYGDVDLYE